VETDDFEGAIAAMNERDVNARWQATMAGFFAEEVAPDSTMKRLTEYFHLHGGAQGSATTTKGRP